MKHYYAGSGERQRPAPPRPPRDREAEWRRDHSCYTAVDALARFHNGKAGTEVEHTGFMVGFAVALQIAIHAPELAQWAYQQEIRENLAAPWNDWTEAQYHDDGREEAQRFAGYVASTGAFDRVLEEAAQ